MIALNSKMASHRKLTTLYPQVFKTSETDRILFLDHVSNLNVSSQLTDIVDGLIVSDIFEVGAERRLKNTTTERLHVNLLHYYRIELLKTENSDSVVMFPYYNA